MPSAASASGPSVLKSAVRGSAVYAIPLVAQRAIGIVILSLITRVLTPAEMGMLSLFEQVTAVITVLFGGRFASALGYFYFQSESETDRNRVVGTAVAGSILLGVAAAAASLPFCGAIAHYVFRTAEAQRYLPAVLIGIPFGLLMEALFGWLRVADRQKAFTIGSLLRVVLTAIGIIVLVGILRFRAMACVLNNLAVMIVVCAVLGGYLLRSARVAWSSAVFWSMLRFSAPLALSWAGMFVINFGDQFILPQYRGLDEVGIYTFAYRIGMLISVALASFFTYWNAQVYQILRRDDAETIFARFLTYFTLLVCACSLLLILGARPGLRILASPAFLPVATIVPLLVASNAIRAIGEFVRTRFLAHGLPQIDTYCTWIGLAVCVPAYFLLIPRFGMWGAGAATFLTLAVMGIVSVVWAYHSRPYLIERGRIVKMTGVTTAILIVYYCVPVSSLPLQIAWSILLLGLFPAALWLLRFETDAERRVIVSLLVRTREHLCVACARSNFLQR